MGSLTKSFTNTQADRVQRKREHVVESKFCKAITALNNPNVSLRTRSVACALTQTDNTLALLSHYVDCVVVILVTDMNRH